MIDIHALHAAINFLGFWALFIFSGLLIAKAWLVPSHVFMDSEVYLRWRRMLAECFMIMAFAGGMLLLVRTGELDEGTLFKVLSDLPFVITKTHFGWVWLVHLITLLLIWTCCAVVLSERPSNAWNTLMVAGMLVLAFTYSASSHASDNGDFTLAELADWAHVVATAAWGGGIFVSALLVFPLLKERHALMSTVAIRLSGLSGAALAVVLTTGIYGSSRQLPDWHALLGTTYGRVLFAKLAIVSILIAIGAFNRFVPVSRIRKHAQGHLLAPGGALRVLFYTLSVDAVLVLFAIVMAAILVQNEAR